MPARSRASQAGHLAARVLGIKLVEHETRERHDAVTRGESVASKCVISTADRLTAQVHARRRQGVLRAVPHRGRLHQVVHPLPRRLVALRQEPAAVPAVDPLLQPDLAHGRSDRRHHRRRRCRAAGHGLRQAGQPAGRVRTLLVVRRRHDLLVLRHLERVRRTRSRPH